MAIIGGGDEALKASPEFVELMAGTRGGKIVRGLGQTKARKATVDEQWRFGVELRITGSRWRTQGRAPHYPEVKPYVYKKHVHSLAWCEADHNRDIDDDYRAWLAERDAAKAKVVEAGCLAALAAAEPVEVEEPPPPVIAPANRRRAEQWPLDGVLHLAVNLKDEEF